MKICERFFYKMLAAGRFLPPSEIFSPRAKERLLQLLLLSANFICNKVSCVNIYYLFFLFFILSLQLLRLTSLGNQSQQK